MFLVHTSGENRYFEARFYHGKVFHRTNQFQRLNRPEAQLLLLRSSFEHELHYGQHVLQRQVLHLKSRRCVCPSIRKSGEATPRDLQYIALLGTCKT
jgi:hypothetical protein